MATRDSELTTAAAAEPGVPTIDHAGFLEDLTEMPGYLLPGHEARHALNGSISCSFCGVGDGGTSERVPDGVGASADNALGGIRLTAFKEVIRGTAPSTGCVKLRHSTMRQRVAYPIHLAPSVLDRATGRRRAISYSEAISRFADLLLAHRAERARTLIYASGQVDYFAIFAMQEVFRLLGIRNLTGNAEHCLNAGAVHNEILTGQEGPFLTIDQAVKGPDRFYLFNGWNGFVSHPPVFKAIMSRPDVDAFLMEVVVTESAKALAKELGPARVVLLRPRSDPQFALAVAHEILARYPEAIDTRFIGRFSSTPTFEKFQALAASPAYSPERVAERIAPEPVYVARVLHAIKLIALKMATPGTVPINVPSVGLSQSSGVVAHCLWGNVMAMVGKYGLRSPGAPAGGTLRIPGQINAESEVQGLSRKYFMGRIPMASASEAARRMGLPDDAYDRVIKESPRAALDYSDPTPGDRELFVCMGTQFESNMMGRRRWIEKLRAQGNTLVVIDPIPDPFTDQHAELIIPSPPHPAAPKLYQNGEWKLTLSVPQKRAARETRSDATIVYDVMAEIARRLDSDALLATNHEELARHARSGYLRRRFCAPEHGGGLTRVDGEVSRPELWNRVVEYMNGGCGPLYCTPEGADGRPIAWNEFLTHGAMYYGGVGTTRFHLDYGNPDAAPFRDIYRRPGEFKFFFPTEADLEIPTGEIFNTGRSSLSDERDRVAFATSTFNSGKATPIANMPDEHPLFISESLAAKHGLKTGDRARATQRASGDSIELPVVVTDRVKGETMYVSFHKSRAQMDRGAYVNDVTSNVGRCPYCAQSNLKSTQVQLERVQPRIVEPAVTSRLRIDTTLIDPRSEMPVWSGQNTTLHVTEVIRETSDVYTFRFQGDPLCRFVYSPGQFCSFVLNIDGKKVVRSYSISSTPTRPYVLEVTVKRVPGGLVSNWLPDNLVPGSQVEISGPKGKFCLVPGRIPQKILFLAAGSGVTPLMSMSRWLCDVSAEVDIKFFNSVRSPEDIIFEKELEMLTSRYRIFEPIFLSASRGGSRGWTGMTGRISRPLLEMVAPDLHDRHIYMCGPEGFMDASRALLTEMNFDLARLHAESFGGLRTAVANKQAPAGAANEPDPAIASDARFSVQFARAGKTAKTNGRMPLLDIAEANDVDVDYGCRTGQCGECKVRLLQGEVDMTECDGLAPADRAAGFVLACVATPRTDCVVD